MSFACQEVFSIDHRRGEQDDWTSSATVHDSVSSKRNRRTHFHQLKLLLVPTQEGSRSKGTIGRYYSTALRMSDVSSFKCYKYTHILSMFDGLTPLHHALYSFGGSSSSSDELLYIPEKEPSSVSYWNPGPTLLL